MFLCCKCFEEKGVVFFFYTIAYGTYLANSGHSANVCEINVHSQMQFHRQTALQNHESVAVFREQRKIDHARGSTLNPMSTTLPISVESYYSLSIQSLFMHRYLDREVSYLPLKAETINIVILW